MRVSFLLSLSLLRLVEKLRLKIQKQSRKSQLAPLCLEQCLHWYWQWMKMLAQCGVNGGLHGGLSRNCCFSLARLPAWRKPCRSIPPPPKLNPLRAGSFIIWEPSIPIRSWERVRKCGSWWSVVSCQSCIFILRLRTSLLVLAAQECQIMDYLQVDLLIYFPSAPFYESSYEIIINISSVYWAPTIHHILFHLCCLL